MPSSTSSSSTLAEFPWPSRACYVGVALFIGARLFFVLEPGFFDPIPESATEYYFYSNDLALKAARPEAQIVIQGTSRSQSIDLIPIGSRRWHTRDRLYNASQPLNTWWQMAALIRRNPTLIDHADLWLIDVLPFQACWGHGLQASDRLFLRESTFREKWLIDSRWDRLRAFADSIVPAWSHSHTVANWWRAIQLVRSGNAARLEHIRSGGYKERYADREDANIFEVINTDPDEARRSFADILYPDSRVSRVQLNALAFLVASRPPQTHLLFFHGAYNEAFEAVAGEDRLARSRTEMAKLLEPALADTVHFIWQQEASSAGLNQDDFHVDGVHLNRAGIDKTVYELALWYRAAADRKHNGN